MRQFFWILLLILPFFIVGCFTLADPSPLETSNYLIETLSITFLPASEFASPTAVSSPTQDQFLATQTAPPKQIPISTPTVVPTQTSTPHPLYPFTIAGLREREFPSSRITILNRRQQHEAFTEYYVEYPSDGINITGLMYIPTGSPPFPVLILMHGYYDRGQYFAGAGTWQVAEYFAQQGYLVISPDYRSWGESETGLSLFHMGLVIDVLSLINAISSLPEADASRIGLWGHSMGGGLATKVLVIDERIRAAVLYAPNSADDADLIARWGIGCLPNQSQTSGDMCNPAEIIPLETHPEIINAYRLAATDPTFFQEVAPIYHLETAVAPIQVHIGSADGQRLGETPPEWSAKLVAALEALDKDVSYFIYPEQGHFFTGQSWVTMVERSLTFFDEQLLTPDS